MIKKLNQRLMQFKLYRLLAGGLYVRFRSGPWLMAEHVPSSPLAPLVRVHDDTGAFTIAFDDSNIYDVEEH